MLITAHYLKINRFPVACKGFLWYKHFFKNSIVGGGAKKICPLSLILYSRHNRQEKGTDNLIISKVGTCVGVCLAPMPTMRPMSSGTEIYKSIIFLGVGEGGIWSYAVHTLELS